MNLFTVITLLLANIGLALCGACPPAEDIAPCTCDTITIKCTANHDFDLDVVFESLAKIYPNNPFYNFELTSDTIDTLDADIFQGVTFQNIRLLNCPKLKCIHPSAFHGLAQTAYTFTSVNTDLSADSDKNCNLFGALSSLLVLQIVNISGSGLTEIPDDAFNGKAGQQLYLQTIAFTGIGDRRGSITNIGSNAFARLKNLMHIELFNHNISEIAENAFNFYEPSYNYLTINLENNNLNPDSFGSDSLEVSSRITTVRLGANTKLRVLSKAVFHSLLEQKPIVAVQNSIDLRGSPLDLVEENKWLITERVRLNLQAKVTNALTHDGTSIFSHTSIEITTPAPTGPASTKNGTHDSY